jgi:hypothetical protein
LKSQNEASKTSNTFLAVRMIPEQIMA